MRIQRVWHVAHEIEQGEEKSRVLILTMPSEREREREREGVRKCNLASHATLLLITPIAGEESHVCAH